MQKINMRGTLRSVRFIEPVWPTFSPHGRQYDDLFTASRNQTTIRASYIVTLHVTAIRTEEDLRPHLDAWSEVVEHRPMRSPAWMLQWWRHYRTPYRELNVLLVHDQDQLVGIAPFYAAQFGGTSTYKLLGSGTACTDHTTLYAQPPHQIEVGRAIAHHFLSLQNWNRLQLDSVDVHDAAIQSMVGHLREADALTHAKPSPHCWLLDLPASWEEYLQRLSKSHRKRCRRLVRKYFDSGRVSFHEATEDNFDRIWHEFLRLHAERWRCQQRSAGVFSESRFEHFHYSVAREFLKQGHLRLCVMESDGRLIAAEYQFVDHDTLYAYQSGMVTDAEDQPGNVSLIGTIRFAIERGLKSIDFLRGDEPYKAHWRAEPAPCHELRIWRKSLTGRVAFTASEARRLAASWFHPSPGSADS